MKRNELFQYVAKGVATHNWGMVIALFAYGEESVNYFLCTYHHCTLNSFKFTSMHSRICTALEDERTLHTGQIQARPHRGVLGMGGG